MSVEVLSLSFSCLSILVDEREYYSILFLDSQSHPHQITVQEETPWWKLFPIDKNFCDFVFEWTKIWLFWHEGLSVGYSARASDPFRAGITFVHDSFWHIDKRSVPWRKLEKAPVGTTTPNWAVSNWHGSQPRLGCKAVRFLYLGWTRNSRSWVGMRSRKMTDGNATQHPSEPRRQGTLFVSYKKKYWRLTYIQTDDLIVTR